jgi:hypothetical protein
LDSYRSRPGCSSSSNFCIRRQCCIDDFLIKLTFSRLITLSCPILISFTQESWNQKGLWMCKLHADTALLPTLLNCFFSSLVVQKRRPIIICYLANENSWPGICWSETQYMFRVWCRIQLVLRSSLFISEFSIYRVSRRRCRICCVSKGVCLNGMILRKLSAWISRRIRRKMIKPSNLVCVIVPNWNFRL